MTMHIVPCICTPLKGFSGIDKLWEKRDLGMKEQKESNQLVGEVNLVKMPKSHTLERIYAYITGKNKSGLRG